MIKIEIKSVFGKVLFSYEKENNTLKETILEAINSNADLSGANLRYADLRYANLRYADLSNAYLSNADLRYANLRYADLSNANLRGVNLSNADLSNANLSNAYLSGANLRGVKNKKTTYLPIYCKWNHCIIGDKIKIGCKEKKIKEWDSFFASEKEYETNRNTEEFKQIEAVFNAYKAYLQTLNK